MISEQPLTQGASQHKTIRLVRPSVVVLCGPAGCGKSTFAARHFRPTQIISSDQARALVCDDEQDQRFQDQAFALLHFIIEQRLGINRLCVVDSTALTQPARKSLLELGRKYQTPCVVFLFDMSLETCLAHDQVRERSVGRATIERQYQLFEQVKSTIGQEGFDQVFELRDEDLDKLQIEIIFRPVPRSVASSVRPEPGTPRRAPHPAPAPAGIQGVSRNPPPFSRERGSSASSRVVETATPPEAPRPAQSSTSSSSSRGPAEGHDQS